MSRSRFIFLGYCLVRQGIRLVSNYASEFEQFYGCKHYYEHQEDIITRFTYSTKDAYIHYLRFTTCNSFSHTNRVTDQDKN